ncbi:unnamed protein product [Urochloa humidicola]
MKTYELICAGGQYHHPPAELLRGNQNSSSKFFHLRALLSSLTRPFISPPSLPQFLPYPLIHSPPHISSLPLRSSAGGCRQAPASSVPKRRRWRPARAACARKRERQARGRRGQHAWAEEAAACASAEQMVAGARGVSGHEWREAAASCGRAGRLESRAGGAASARQRPHQVSTRATKPTDLHHSHGQFPPLLLAMALPLLDILLCFVS